MKDIKFKFGPLQGKKVLVTRPNQRASGLCQLIEQAGGTALHFATIEITEPTDTRSRDFVRDHLSDFSLAIFISPTAVEQTLDYFNGLPDDIRIAAIGSKTAHALESHGQPIAIKPDGHDTEALLAHPQLQTDQVTGRKVVIFRGEGGRPLLRDTLQARGAEVFYADMYRRSTPLQTAQLNDYLQQADIITISSNEGLQNLYDLAANKQDLTAHVIVVPGKRAYTLAQTLGFKCIMMAENATDEACMNALEYAKVKLSKKS
jgi:uroporphyrinogen-III synthase